MKAINSPFNKRKYSKGFTLLELIVTIIIIGILAVTVLPRFFESSGYEEYTYRAQAISILRNIQLRSMQQDILLCIKVDTTENALGLPDTGTCGASPGFSPSYGDGLAELKVDSGHQVTFSPDRDFSFDKLGRPLGCASPCVITIAGLENANIIIESEGYIHAQE